MTGGHVTPAIATIEVMRARHPDWQILFAGRRTSLEGSSISSEEERLISAMGIPFFPIAAGRLKREGGVASVTAFFKIPQGFVQALRLVRKTRPDVIVTFGGYIALPVAVAGYLFRIPVVTHEQTMYPGLGNRIIAKFARRTAVSFSETKRLMGPGTNVVVTGLPLRSQVTKRSGASALPIPKSVPVLLVTGGSTGSVSINDVVYKALPALCEDFAVVHQVGRLSETKADAVKSSLPERLQARYIPVPYLSPDEFSKLMQTSVLVIGRSGANTVTEAGIASAVAVWIPLPWSAHQEQFHNAKLLSDAGTSRILAQSDLTPDTLITEIRNAVSNRDTMKERARAFSTHIRKDGADRFVRVIEEILTLPHP